MLRNGVVYHSTYYRKSVDGKRNSTYCCFQNKGSVHFGQIELFTMTPKPCALIRQFQHLDMTLANQVGHPCRDTLIPYVNVDLLNSYIVPININAEHCQLEAIPLECVISKVMMVSVMDRHYCVIQPNNTERH